MRVLCVITYLVFILSSSYAQNKTIDSLFTLLKTAKEDTNKVNILNTLARELSTAISPDTAIALSTQALHLAQKLKWDIGIGKSEYNLGSFYDDKGDYEVSLLYNSKALAVWKKLSEDKNFSKPFILTLKSKTLGNIGIVYRNQANYPKALEYFFKALRIDEELKNKKGIARHLGNIGNVYIEQSDYPKALEYFFKALRISEELGDKRSAAINLGNIGTLYTKTGQFKKAEEYLNQSVAIFDSIGSIDGVRDFELSLSQLYDTTGRYKLALEHYKKYIAARDTVDNEEKRKKQAYIEMNHKFEMDAAKMKAEHDKKMAIAREEQRRQRIITYFIAVGLAITLLFSVFIFRSLKITQKQKRIIEKQKQIVEQQKQLVEEKNKEITDSINYAKRIQEAILPNEQKWKELLPESFILYLPKDIVAGDFYWMEETEDYIFVAAADSTGHGVPGAMVSVVCSGALSKAVREERMRDTGKILDKAREIVTEQLSSGEQHLRDGMDVCLVRIDKNNRKKIQYSGANRSLIIIRNGEVIEIKADKQPVGFDEEAKPFAQHDVELESGDSVYLFTDGYADQFGGEKSKKIGNKRFLEMLKEVSKYKVQDRGEKLQEIFTEWKKDQFQVDDVTVIGIDF